MSCAVELLNPSPTVHRFIDILAPDVLDALPPESAEEAEEMSVSTQHRVHTT